MNMQELLLDLQSSEKARWLHSSCHCHCIHKFSPFSGTQPPPNECIFFFMAICGPKSPPPPTSPNTGVKSPHSSIQHIHMATSAFHYVSLLFCHIHQTSLAWHGSAHGSRAHYRRAGHRGCAQTAKGALLVHLSRRSTGVDSICSTLTSDQLCKNNTLTRVTPLRSECAITAERLNWTRFKKLV